MRQRSNVPFDRYGEVLPSVSMESRLKSTAKRSRRTCKRYERG